MRATIKMHRFVLAEIIKHANNNQELECCGYLIGRRKIRNDDIIIDIDAIFHDWNVGTVDHCTFSLVTLHRAKTYAQSLNNGSQVIGNYHSHGLYRAEFSPVDREMQLEWADYKCTLIYSPSHNELVGEIITRNNEAIPARITLYGERTLSQNYISMQKKNSDITYRL